MTAANWRQLTIAIMVAVFAGLCLYDLAALRYGGAEATISQVLFEAAGKNPEIAVLAGILIGHWFWR